MVKRQSVPAPKLTFVAAAYLLVFAAWWVTCFVLLLQGWGLWLLSPLALSLAIAVYTVDSLPAVEDALVACAAVTMVAHAVLLLNMIEPGFNKVHHKDVIVCGATKTGTPSIKTSSGTFTIDDGIYNFGGKDRYIEDFATIARAFNQHKGAKYRLSYHGWDSYYLNSAKLLKGAGQCG